MCDLCYVHKANNQPDLQVLVISFYWCLFKIVQVVFASNTQKIYSHFALLCLSKWYFHATLGENLYLTNSAKCC